MSDAVFLIFAVVMLSIGHFLRAARWSFLIGHFGKECHRSYYYSSLCVGYIANFFIPFRLGELARCWMFYKFSGVNFSYVLSSVIFERLLDIIVVLLVYLIFFQKINHFTLGLAVGLIAITFLITNFYFRRAFLKISSVFNKEIKMSMMFLYWCYFVVTRLIFSNIDKKKLALYTLLMWLSYFSSLYLFFLSAVGANFATLFQLQFTEPTFSISAISNSAVDIIFYAIYIIMPLAILLIYPLLKYLLPSFINRVLRRVFFNNVNYYNLVPYLESRATFIFLSEFFNSTNPSLAAKILEQNKESLIVKDLSGGSDAKTLLIQKDGVNFIRKYSIDSSASKLEDQYNWIKNFEKILPLAQTLNFSKVDDYFSYDMYYDESSQSFFDFIHCNEVEVSWKVIASILGDLEQKLYTNGSAKEDKKVEYVQKKLLSNIDIFRKSFFDHTVSSSDILIINGKVYKNLHLFDLASLSKIIVSKDSGGIHGDLTVENIIIDGAKNYFLIDPNPNNIYNTKFIDYAKLFQSFNMGHEFLIRDISCSINKNVIQFPSIISNKYLLLQQRLSDFCLEKFGREVLFEIRLHEIINCARIIPYKIKKDPQKANLFFAMLVILVNNFFDDLSNSK